MNRLKFALEFVSKFQENVHLLIGYVANKVIGKVQALMFLSKKYKICSTQTENGKDVTA